MKDIVVPERIKLLPKDRRGFPIPFVVFIDKFGEPHFKINDTDKDYECVVNKLCHVCGQPLKFEYWFIGGQLSAYHPRGAFNDGPIHKECGEFALKVCPYLAYTQYTATAAQGTERIAKQLEGKIDTPLYLFNPTQDMKRLPFFCFVKAKTYEVSLLQAGLSPKVFRPQRPYEQVEFYKDGNRIHKAEAKQILQQANETIYLP